MPLRSPVGTLEAGSQQPQTPTLPHNQSNIRDMRYHLNLPARYLKMTAWYRFLICLGFVILTLGNSLAAGQSVVTEVVLRTRNVTVSLCPQVNCFKLIVNGMVETYTVNLDRKKEHGLVPTIIQWPFGKSQRQAYQREMTPDHLASNGSLVIINSTNNSTIFEFAMEWSFGTPGDRVVWVDLQIPEGTQLVWKGPDDGSGARLVDDNKSFQHQLPECHKCARKCLNCAWDCGRCSQT